MDQLAIQTIEDFIDAPLIAPERIHDLDSKEIAAALDRLDNERIAALEEKEDAWSHPEVQDELNRERLGEVTDLLQEAIANCESCNDENPCARCASFTQWIAEA